MALDKIVDSSQLNADLTTVANAIREKGGTSAQLSFPSGMAQAIADIQTGGGGDHDVEDGIIMNTIVSYNNSRVTSIGSFKFTSIDTLKQVSFQNCEKIYQEAFESCHSLTSAAFHRCATIYVRAFANCINLSDISFPACSEIGPSAFYGCYKLPNTNFPACVTIKNDAFAYCSSSLRTAFLPVCTSIEMSAFAACYVLNTVSLPAAKNISAYAFRSCRSLLSLYLYGSSVCTLQGSLAFSSTPIGGYTERTSGVYGSVFVPMSLLSDYQNATNWTYFSSRFVGVNPEDM